LWLSGCRIPCIQACGLARATAQAAGIAPCPGIDARAGPGIHPKMDPGIDPGALRDGKMSSVVP